MEAAAAADSRDPGAEGGTGAEHAASLAGGVEEQAIINIANATALHCFYCMHHNACTGMRSCMHVPPLAGPCTAGWLRNPQQEAHGGFAAPAREAQPAEGCSRNNSIDKFGNSSSSNSNIDGRGNNSISSGADVGGSSHLWDCICSRRFSFECSRGGCCRGGWRPLPGLIIRYSRISAWTCAHNNGSRGGTCTIVISRPRCGREWPPGTWSNCRE